MVTQSKYAANSARERWKAEGARNREGERERERERRSTWPRVANTKFAHTLCTHEWIYLSRYRSYARQAFRDFRKSGEHLAATRLRYRRIVQTLRANLDKCCSKRFSTYRRGCMVNPLRSCAPGHQKKKKKKKKTKKKKEKKKKKKKKKQRKKRKKKKEEPAPGQTVEFWHDSTYYPRSSTENIGPTSVYARSRAVCLLRIPNLTQPPVRSFKNCNYRGEIEC